MINEDELIRIGNRHGYKGKYIFIRHKDVAELIDDMISSKGLRTALNVGCGLGIMEQFLKHRIRLTGIDSEPSAIKVAKKLAIMGKKPYIYKVQSVQSLRKGKRQKFDLIILSEVIEHVKDEKKLLLSLRDMLSSKGILVMSVPNRWQPRNVFRKMFLMKPMIMDVTHLREYSRAGIEGLIRSCGFRIVKSRSSVLYFPQEKLARKIIKEDSKARRGLLKALPGAASHFIYALEKDMTIKK